MKMQCVLFLLLTAATVGQKDDRVSYTAFDSASWAITSDHLSSLLGTDKQVLYDTFIDGCNEEIFQGNETKRTENEMMECKTQDQYRLKMNHDQPTSVYNYTQAGYAKVRAPEALMEIVRKFWNKNKQNAEIEWKQTNVYHNTWQSPPTIVHLNKEDYSGGGPDLQEQIWDMVQPVLEEWTGQYLSPVSLYGIRLYHNNSILAPHVDRMPLVTSAIVQVDQDVDVPWPLEVYGHDGKATNVTMEPGDMVLYESHSVIHGRPFPMQGRFYANFFIHFEVLGPLDGEIKYDPSLGLPPYLIPGSKWEDEWRKNNPKGWSKLSSNDVVAMATKGDSRGLHAISKFNPKALEAPDKLGWTPLHEAVRSGNVETVKFLLSRGADKNLATNSGTTPLWISRHFLGKEHAMTEYLEELGATSTMYHRNKAQGKNDEL